MKSTLFSEIELWLLVFFSIFLPFFLYFVMLVKRVISPHTVLILGLTLVVIAGLDVYLLQRLATLAKTTASLLDHAVFASEVSTALYLLPALCGGIGINVVSQVLVRHLEEAEKRFENDHMNP